MRWLQMFLILFIDHYFPKEFNKSYITLIPKIGSSESINKFRPITICNVIYKIVTKVIINRIRPLLKKIVGPGG